MGSVEAAITQMKLNGRKEIHRLKTLTTRLKEELVDQDLELSFLDEDIRAMGEWVDPTVYDWSKLVIALHRYNISGFELGKQLESRHGIVVEKSGFSTVLFLATFQQRKSAPVDTAEAVNSIIGRAKRRGTEGPAPLGNPFEELARDPEYEPYLVSRLDPGFTSLVEFDRAEGKVAAESIEI